MIQFKTRNYSVSTINYIQRIGGIRWKLLILIANGSLIEMVLWLFVMQISITENSNIA